jgi:hypothetical protein
MTMWAILGAFVVLRIVLRLLPLALVFATFYAIFHGELPGSVLALFAVLVLLALVPRGARRRRL